MCQEEEKKGEGLERKEHGMKANHKEDESKDDDTDEAIENGRGGGDAQVRGGLKAPREITTA